MSETHTPELSVVIPVYNALPYLRECIDSIVSQGFDEERYEVILVDDGSTDGSSAACDAEARRHPNFRVIHQENSGGASRPRNVGIEAARGDYVFFCDADDTLMPKSLNDMLWHAKTLGSDLCCFKIKTDWGSTYNGLFDHPRRHCTIDDDPILDFFGSYKLHRRDLLERSGARYIEGIIPEDWAFGLENYLNAENICVVCDREYYHYRKRGDGTSLTHSNLTAQAKDWDSKVKAFEAYFTCASRYVDVDEHPRLALRLCRWLSASIYGTSSDVLTQKGASELSALLASHYTEDVRALCPLSVLMACDALVGDPDLDHLREVTRTIRGNGAIEFESVDDGNRAYVVRSGSGEKVLSGKMPSRLGEELASPKFRTARLDACRASTSTVELEGRSFAILRESDVNPAGMRMLARTKDGDTWLELPTTISDWQIEGAYDGTVVARTCWKSSFGVKDLTRLLKSGELERIDLYVGEAKPEGGYAHNRLGSVREKTCFEAGWVNAVSSSEMGLLPTLTGPGNLSLVPFELISAVDAARECRVVAIRPHGRSLEVEGTLVCPKRPGISATFDIRTRDARESLLATCKASLVWDEGNDALCRWSARLPLKAAARVTTHAFGGAAKGTVSKVIGTAFKRESGGDAVGNPLRLRMTLGQNSARRILGVGGLRPKELASALRGGSR